MRFIKHLVPHMIFFILVLLIPVYAGASNSTTVSCYVANSSGYDHVGELEVFNLAEAAIACNNVYASCQGKCIGCYLDAESFEICIDKNGNQSGRE